MSISYCRTISYDRFEPDVSSAAELWVIEDPFKSKHTQKGV